MIKAEVALYPVIAEDISKLRGFSKQFLDEHGLDYDFHLGSTSLNTTLTGSKDQIWATLRQLFEQSQQDGQDIVMITTLIHFGDIGSGLVENGNNTISFSE